MSTTLSVPSLKTWKVLWRRSLTLLCIFPLTARRRVNSWTSGSSDRLSTRCVPIGAASPVVQQRRS
ncbi:hypothetical protein PR003_g15455 [Phytophthora rubi]|uniref:Uncharacterized protein n=1 Tax=Phytophthora rubi TaxID=129364 RepID=A0A6A3JR62_9STRA|nr:hypothetical protein PR002_g19341 [Phytophthora rubi]KAE9003974.1 hypothetical protein PR001_g17838 [Phytophthora rubi]KAE9329876.1 hypothetical protein PR003_g15455 [Phytophthora rubi]